MYNCTLALSSFAVDNNFNKLSLLVTTCALLQKPTSTEQIKTTATLFLFLENRCLFPAN